MAVMPYFRELGARVDEAWRRRSYLEEAFSEVASLCLEASRPCDATSAEDIAARYLERGVSGHDDVVDGASVTLFRDARFEILARLWRRGSARVEQHASAGAFHTLDGESLHVRYEFLLDRLVGRHLLVGDLALNRAECLRKGSTREIRIGGSIHALFHLERPSATILVRTRRPQDAAFGPHFLRPYFGVLPSSPASEVNRDAKLLSSAAGRGRDALAELVGAIAREGDFGAIFSMARRMQSGEPGLARSMLREARRRHGTLADMALLALDELQRQAVLTRYLDELQGREHRFFLAVLLNLPNRESSLDVIRERCAAPPLDLVVRWLQELSGAHDGGGPLGLRLDEPALELFSCKLNRRSFAEALGRLSEIYSGEEVSREEESLRDLWAAFERAPLLRSLFADVDVALEFKPSVF